MSFKEYKQDNEFKDIKKLKTFIINALEATGWEKDDVVIVNLIYFRNIVLN